MKAMYPSKQEAMQPPFDLIKFHESDSLRSLEQVINDERQQIEQGPHGAPSDEESLSAEVQGIQQVQDKLEKRAREAAQAQKQPNLKWVIELDKHSPSATLAAAAKLAEDEARISPGFAKYMVRLREQQAANRLLPCYCTKD